MWSLSGHVADILGSCTAGTSYFMKTPYRKVSSGALRSLPSVVD